MEHGARPDRGELVSIAHQNKPAAGRQRTEQVPCCHHIHHTDLVDQDQVRLQCFRRLQFMDFIRRQV